MKLSITTGDIKAAIRVRKKFGTVSGFDCPAAIAARRAFKQDVYADGEFLYLLKDGRVVAMHSELITWVAAFDSGDRVAPIEFDLLDHEEPSSI